MADLTRNNRRRAQTKAIRSHLRKVAIAILPVTRVAQWEGFGEQALVGERASTIKSLAPGYFRRLTGMLTVLSHERSFALQIDMYRFIRKSDSTLAFI